MLALPVLLGARFREGEETRRKNSALIACRNSGMVKRYDLKTKQDHAYYFREHQSLSEIS